MSKISLKRLESIENMRDFLYHVKEILETQDDIFNRLVKLDRNWNINQNETEKLISRLEVDIFDHLLYHIRELREPFNNALEKVFGEQTGEE